MHLKKIYFFNNFVIKLSVGRVNAEVVKLNFFQIFWSKIEGQIWRNKNTLIYFFLLLNFVFFPFLDLSGKIEGKTSVLEKQVMNIQ